MYKSSLRFLGIRLRSEYEIRSKIKEWYKKDIFKECSLEERVILEDRVVDQLKKDRFVDDARFAAEWVYSRVRSKPRGEFILKMELAKKGIPKDLIDETLEKILYVEDNGYNKQSSEIEMARRVAQKYAKRLVNEDTMAYKFKLSQALARKGFASDATRTVVDEFLDKRYNSIE
ncbi:MAG: RecX family transcriptional regulator [bacterium]|nr:RecX family transcriptional regulator [bacterium]